MYPYKKEENNDSRESEALDKYDEGLKRRYSDKDENEEWDEPGPSNQEPEEYGYSKYCFLCSDATNVVHRLILRELEGTLEQLTRKLILPCMNMVLLIPNVADVGKQEEEEVEDFDGTKLEVNDEEQESESARVAIDPSKIKAMENWPVPANVKQLRGFLGLIGHYKRFIKACASISKPLIVLLQKNGFKWNNEAQLAFEQLKQAMTSAPACDDFVSDERIVWVDIEGVPLKAWSRETFTRIGKIWGETLDWKENAGIFIRTVYMESYFLEYKERSTRSDVGMKIRMLLIQMTHLDYMTYEIREGSYNHVVGALVVTPQGVTPGNIGEFKLRNLLKWCSKGQNVVKSGGLVLDVMEDIIRVGQVMGYSMEGCVKDLENIIGKQGTRIMVFR
ncbi:hypothetical protein Tco_0786089 [Tanacetum coccineum]